MSRDSRGAWMTGGFSSAAAADSGSSSPSSEYKRQLRAQCIDQHSRHHQHAADHALVLHPRPVRSSTFRGGEVGGRERWNPSAGRPLAEYSTPGLHRSNSSLELDSGSGLEAVPAGGVLCRDYGSVNSLDKVDCFSTILRNYRQSIDELDIDARKQPAQSRGQSAAADTSPKTSSTADSCTVFNGFLQPGDDLGSGVANSAPSPKSKSQKSKDRKSRSESGNSGTSLFRKLRGVKSDPYSGSEQSDSLSSGAGESSPKLEDRIRKKAFSHYDCQSIGVTVTEVVKRRAGSGSGSDMCLARHANTSTGASAASTTALRGDGTLDVAGPAHADEPLDAGDGKSNDLVDSCSYFRNEVGGEEERTVALTRRVAERRHQPADFVTSAACNGVAVLDSSASSDGTVESPLLIYNNFVLEYVDQGAFYYRRFFYAHGTPSHVGLFKINEPNISAILARLRPSA